MLQILNSGDPSFVIKLEELLSRSRYSHGDITSSVMKIINEVRNNKDSALLAFTQKFDNQTFKRGQILLSGEEITEACHKVSSDHKRAIDFAVERITDFHKKQRPKDKKWIDETGIELGWKWRPINSVGLYVPGGTASYPSSVLMNAVPARIAGVNEIVMVSPASAGKINPAVLYAATVSGVKKIYRVGGAQAVAALAFGTETVMRVDKIVGPGNAYVAEAKRQVFGRVGIDMVAGPSEVVIIADADNNPAWISSDLLSQAEHDSDAQSVLITTSKNFAEKVIYSLNTQLNTLDRKRIAHESLKKNGVVIVVDDLEKAAMLANRFAPEHLQLCVNDPDKLLEKIENAGSVFLGAWTPEVLGDYIIGTNHVLPTETSARFASGLSVLDFMKRSFISKVSPLAVQYVGESASTFAELEGLGAHKLSIELRMRASKKKIKNDD